MGDVQSHDQGPQRVNEGSTISPNAMKRICGVKTTFNPSQIASSWNDRVGGNVQSLHISCGSDRPLQYGVNYGGIFLFDAGSWRTPPGFEGHGRRISPGYIIIKNCGRLPDPPGGCEGVVHGKLCHWFFGNHPSVLYKNHDQKLVGFSLHRSDGGEYVFKAVSRSLNMATKGKATLDDFEDNFLRLMLIRWACTGFRLGRSEQTATVKELVELARQL